MYKVVVSKNCSKWLRLHIEASVLLMNTKESIRKYLVDLPWLDFEYKHKDNPNKLLAMHGIFLVDDKDKISIIRGEEELLATIQLERNNLSDDEM